MGVTDTGFPRPRWPGPGGPKTFWSGCRRHVWAGPLPEDLRAAGALLAVPGEACALKPRQAALPTLWPASRSGHVNACRPLTVPMQSDPICVADLVPGDMGKAVQ